MFMGSRVPGALKIGPGPPITKRGVAPGAAPCVLTYSSFPVTGITSNCLYVAAAFTFLEDLLQDPPKNPYAHQDEKDNQRIPQGIITKKDYVHCYLLWLKPHCITPREETRYGSDQEGKGNSPRAIRTSWVIKMGFRPFSLAGFARLTMHRGHR